MDLLSPYHPVIGHKLLHRGRGSSVKSPTMEGNFLEETQCELTAANMLLGDGSVIPEESQRGPKYEGKIGGVSVNIRFSLIPKLFLRPDFYTNRKDIYIIPYTYLLFLK